MLARAPFFLDSEDAGLRVAFKARHPRGYERLLAQADAALGGDLSWVVPGGTQDWHRALPGDDRWPVAEEPVLDIGAEHPIGDVRLNWEIGRCTHLLRLAQAAWLTREQRYAEAAVAGLRSFERENPAGLGVAWLQAQEVAIRGTTWLWIFHLLRDSAAFDSSAFRLWIKQMLAHGEYVRAFPSGRVVTHNHLITELAALAILGISLPVFRSAAHWRRLGLRWLFREILKQTDEDGVSGEGSTHYHAFVLDSCIAVLALAGKAGIEVPTQVRERIGCMAGFVAHLIRSDGSIPVIGDTDGGRAWRLGLDPMDRRDVLAAGAIMLDRADWGAIAGDAAGAFWISGGRPVPGANDTLPKGGFKAFRSAGLVTARTGYGRGEEIFIFRVGPTHLLTDVRTGHAHADALSVGLHVGEEDVLLDPGNFRYSEGEGWRSLMRGSEAHSCPVIDRADQADVTMRFGVSGLRSSRWLWCSGDDEHLFAEAEHPADGFPRARRVIAWLRGGALVLFDQIVGTGRHEVAIWLQFPESSGEAQDDHVRLKLHSGRVVLVQGLIGAGKIAVRRPGKGPSRGWYSPRYGVLRPGTAVTIAAASDELPVKMLTAIQLGVVGDPEPAIAESRADGGVSMRVGGEILEFPPDHGVRRKTPHE